MKRRLSRLPWLAARRTFINADRLANRGLRVIIAGLDQDYLGRPFHPMPALMAIAEEVTKVGLTPTRVPDPADVRVVTAPDT